jgi:enoyl-[acyl-carrier protein] reductase III
LRADFGLSESLRAAPEELRTVASVADLIGRALAPAPRAAAIPPSAGARGSSPPVAERTRTTAPARPTNGHSPAPALSLVVDTFAEATRHPRDLLVPEARLEEDLGIGPARTAEILDLLGTRAKLPQPPAGSPHTLGDVARLLGRGGRPAEPDPEPQPPPARARSAELAGKTILVSGSSRGLGRVVALRLAELGARVIVNSFHSRDQGEEVADVIRRAGGQALHLWGSVANPGHVDRMFAALEREAGELHGYVSSASNGRFAPLEEITPEHWELAFRTNVIGFHQCALRAARLMERSGGGRVVAVSSNGSSRYLEHFGAMGAVKAAIESLARALAVELAPRKVQVNCVAAGPIYGAVTSGYPDHERLLPYWESRALGSRLCCEEDVAEAIQFLLSDRARMINGATLTVDAGGGVRL